MKETLFAFENYGFQYRAQSKPTLHGIDLKIHKGEKILIVGPSGSGKSTVANCINGLIPFNYTGTVTGKLVTGGEETKDMSIFDLSKIVGTVLQDPDGQFVGLTAGEDIAFSLENDCVDISEMRERVQKAAEMVGIENELDASPFDLSGGQKQRVSMAGVVINEVQMLLFDEPLANLDPKAGKQTIEQIEDLIHKTGSTVVIIEHRLEDVLHRSVDRIVLMHEGEILADMPPDALLSSSLLLENGIREPLYLTALKYAGVKITPDKQPGLITSLRLGDTDKQAVLNWYQATQPKSPLQKGEVLLQAKELSFSYDGEKTVLSGVSFAISRGEMVAIAGTNGAGKSTLAKLICGFEPLTRGKLSLHGQDMAGMTISQRAEHIGYVMQNPNQMISKAMIFDEVALGLRSRDIPEEEIKERVEATLKICGLYPFRNWPVAALSFGQKKRVTIASVLVMNPEIIILDEPTSGQDFKHYTEIMEFLSRLNGEGVTVIMITHDMHLMLEYAPRALVFSQGKLLADSTSAKVLTDKALTEQASLKRTSLYDLAGMCGIEDRAGFVQHFIDYDRGMRAHGQE